MDYNAESIKRHRQTRGKVAIVSKMPLETAEDLSIAYTPGVGAVSLAIAANKEESFAMTNRGNMVAVVSDGSAVLGIGNVGPEAAMAVMEGKAILFKTLADIDAIPICLATQNSKEIINTVRYLVPTFGGVNLEDIAAPRCFEIENALQDLGIPVMHDDQHGTAMVVLAALINAAKVLGKRIEDAKIVFSGAGAAAIATTRLLQAYGAKNVTLVDSKGIIQRDRRDLTDVKKEVVQNTNPENLKGSITDALRGADVFIGLSMAGLVTGDMVRSMAKDPIVFAMANPVPEIMPDLAQKAGAAVVGTGRSDFANQINNCLAFPGVFRGALDVRAPRITIGMKMAASRALASLVERPTPERVIPAALDRKVVPAVSRAASEAWIAESRASRATTPARTTTTARA